MNDVRYMISEAAKLVDVEQHTLRYWEDELELDIPRNEMGHRYYRDKDIELLKVVSTFKEKGYQLRAIKMLIPEIQMKTLSNPDDIDELKKTCDARNIEIVSEDNIFEPMNVGLSYVKEDRIHSINGDNSIDKMERFRTIMKDLIMEALEDNNSTLADTVSEEISSSVVKEIDYLLRLKEEREEERFQRFDRTIREVQSAREESASSKLFKRRRKTIFYR